MKSKIILAAAAIAGLQACSSRHIQQSVGNPGKLDLPTFNLEGHRGTRGMMPENTIPAMKRGIDYGSNTVELDIVISRDGQVVVSHDIYFHPDISTFPNGQPVNSKEGPSLLLSKMDYDSIRKYDVGLKPYKDFPLQQKMPAYKPLLAELVDSVDQYAAALNRPVIYNIEIKGNKDWDGVKTPPIQEIVDRTMKVVRAKKLEHHAYLQSFDFRALQILHRDYPDITTAVLISEKDKRSLEQQLADLGYVPAMYSPQYSVVTPELVKACHAKKMKIIPWTVDTKEEMKKLIDMGVDGIITDYPNYFKEL